MSFLNTNLVVNYIQNDSYYKNLNKSLEEAIAISIIIQNFLDCGIDKKSFLILTPFLNQSKLLKNCLKKFGI